MPVSSDPARESPSLLLSALDVLDVPFMVVDATGEPAFMNAAWRRAHGLSAGPVAWAQLARSRQLMAADGVTAVAEDELPSRRALQGVRHQAEVVLDARGVRTRWLVAAHPVFDRSGEVVGAAVRGLDVSLLRPQGQAFVEDAEQMALLAEACRAVLREADARSVICRAARTVCEAVGASLWEPDHDGDLRATAADGPVPLGMRLPAGRASNAARAFSRVRTITANHVGAGSGANSEVIDTVSTLAGQQIEAGIWVPVVAQGRCLAVLVVGLSGAQASSGSTAARLESYVPVLEVLAGEAAIAIERQDLLARLRVEAGTDPLTGVANRRAWEQELPRCLQRSAAAGATVSLAMLDLDRFKTYNDQHGHPAGDALLQEMARLWQRRLRPGDLLSRIGGEEFALVLPRCDVTAARRVAEDLRALVPRGQTVSVGLAQWKHDEPLNALIERADAALYSAKRAGRDRTSIAE